MGYDTFVTTNDVLKGRTSGIVRLDELSRSMDRVRNVKDRIHNMYTMALWRLDNDPYISKNTIELARVITSYIIVIHRVKVYYRYA